MSLPAFRQYHAQDAWTWERMALTRARVVAGTTAIRARTEAAVATALAIIEDPGQVRADAAAMRGRLARELPPAGPWDVKMRSGGGIEVEFIAQALQLIHGVRPGQQATRFVLRRLADEGHMPQETAAMLIQADRLWRTVQSMVRITVGRGATELPAPALDALLRAVGQQLGLPGLTSPQLGATLDATARDVRTAFTSLIGVPE